MRYNQSTDMIQIKYNGVWTDWKRVYMNQLYVYDVNNGGFQDGYTFYQTTSQGGETPTITSSGILLKIVSSPSGTWYSAGSWASHTGPIDFTNATKAVFTTSIGTYEVDVSTLSDNGFLCAYCTGQAGSADACGFGFAVQDTAHSTSYLADTGLIKKALNTTMYVYSMYVE